MTGKPIAERSLSESLCGSPTSTSFQMLTNRVLSQNTDTVLRSALGALALGDCRGGL